MAKSYQGMIAGGRGGASIRAHCNAIVVNRETITAEYAAIAAAHRQMGQEAKP